MPVCFVCYVKRHVCPGEVLEPLVTTSVASDTGKDTGLLLVRSTANPPPLSDEVMPAGDASLLSLPSLGFNVIVLSKFMLAVMTQNN